MCRNDVVGHLAAIDDMAQHISTLIPMQVIVDIDNALNPMHLTRERLERAATENQFMNGKIAAITVRLGLIFLSVYENIAVLVIPQVAG